MKNNSHATRTTHGDTGTRLYTIWNTMKQRCKNPKSICYKVYGGKGIKVCDEWQHYENFKEWSTKNGYEENLTIDRIDSDKDYMPSNCRWVDMKTQQNNRCNNHLITYKNETYTLSQWANKIGLSPSTLSRRMIKSGA